jgi:alanine racemase
MARSLLTFDLAALAANWRALKALSGGARTGAAVKADAYGLGAAEIVPALVEAGCRDFFVADIGEGIAARKVAGDARIFVLAGLDAANVGEYAAHDLAPVLNCIEDTETWLAHGDGRPCALHFDTGMNRLGMAARDIERAAAAAKRLNFALVMSHLACGDEPAHAKNRGQLDAFRKISARFPRAPASLAASGGIFLGADFHFDLTRPGIALYGGQPVIGQPNPMAVVVTFEAAILQVRRAAKGETIGYGATQTLARDSVIAVTAAGYADGFPRAASGSDAAPSRVEGWLAGHRVTLLGRVSMDLSAFDVTDVPEETLAKATAIELFGPHAPLDEFARACGTISYEVLTRMGKRAERKYTRQSVAGSDDASSVDANKDPSG